MNKILIILITSIFSVKVSLAEKCHPKILGNINYQINEIVNKEVRVNLELEKILNNSLKHYKNFLSTDELERFNFLYLVGDTPANYKYDFSQSKVTDLEFIKETKFKDFIEEVSKLGFEKKVKVYGKYLPKDVKVLNDYIEKTKRKNKANSSIFIVKTLAKLIGKSKVSVTNYMLNMSHSSHSNIACISTAMFVKEAIRSEDELDFFYEDNFKQLLCSEMTNHFVKKIDQGHLPSSFLENFPKTYSLGVKCNVLESINKSLSSINQELELTKSLLALFLVMDT